MIDKFYKTTISCLIWYFLKMHYRITLLINGEPPKLFFSSPFLTRKYFLVTGKQMHWTTWVFCCFSYIFCCELQFYQWALVLSTEIFSFSSEWKVCWALKSWVFPVNEKRSLSEPEKLKISGRSTLEWTGKTKDFRAQHTFRSLGKTKDFRAQHTFRSLEKLKISVLSTKAHW